MRIGGNPNIKYYGFKKGNKLGGRKPIPEISKKILSDNSPNMINLIIQFAKNSELPPAVRLEAAKYIVDRDLGRPAQAITGDVNNPLTLAISHFQKNLEKYFEPEQSINNEPELKSEK